MTDVVSRTTQRHDDAAVRALSLLGATSRLDSPVRLSRLALRYAVTGLVTLMVVAVATAFASRRLGTEEAIRDANRYAALAADAAVEPVLTDGLLDGDPTALAAVDEVVRGTLIDDPLVRVKIWSRDGTVLYSDESRLIGERFDLDEEELRALDTGASRAGISDLDEPENRFEEKATQLLEVYLPVTTTDGTVVLFEAYFRYDGVAEQGRRIWLSFAVFSLAALALLELLRVPLVLSLGRRLQRTQRQREQLLENAIEATEDERRRIAGDLHDGVVQDLAGVAFSLAATARLGEDADRRTTTELVEESAVRVRDAVRSLRSLLVEIYPTNLQEEGIEGALSDLLARLRHRGITTALTVDPAVRGLDLETTQLLYRTSLEALRNVTAHADASHVEVRLRCEGTRWVLEIADDGRGLPDGRVPDRGGHLGLRTLAGRAADIGGALTVSSVAGKGTTLRLEVPAR